MTDMELAEEIEQHKLYLGGYPTEAQCEQIIAALRRVPIAKHCLAGDGGCTFHKCDCPTQEGYSPTDRQATQNLTRPPSGEMVMVPREPTKAMLSAAGWALGDYYAKEGGWCGHKAGEEQARLTYIAMLSEAEGRNGYAFTVDRKQFCSPQKRASIAELKAIYGRGGDEFWFVKDPSNKQTGRKTLYDAEIVDLEFTSVFYVDLPARM